MTAQLAPEPHKHKETKKAVESIMAYTGATAHVEEQVVWFSSFHSECECVEIAGGDFWFVSTHTIPGC